MKKRNRGKAVVEEPTLEIECTKPAIMGHYPVLSFYMTEEALITTRIGLSVMMRHAFMWGRTGRVTWQEYCDRSTRSTSTWDEERKIALIQQRAKEQGFVLEG